MRPRMLLSPGGFLLTVGLLTPLLIIAACLLPHDRHERFSTLHQFEVMKAGWIYERIHNNPTPIDVVFIGSSHTVDGVDSTRVEQAIAAASGTKLHVVNFGMVHLGRDMQYLLAREAIESRPVKLLVVEVQESESRALHPAFGSLAGVADILDAPVLVNTNYLSDLAHLPLRQIRLAAASLIPAWFDPPGAARTWYADAHWDDVFDAHTAAGLRPRRPQSHTPEELERERRHLEAHLPTLPGPLKPLETRANLVYLRRMLETARRAGVVVRFLYLPTYASAPRPAFENVYAAWGTVWYPRDVLKHVEWWQDVGHLNQMGAEALSVWLGRQLAQEMPTLAIRAGNKTLEE